MKYTAAQEKAINTIDRNLQIIACAGSGKTQVISMRVVKILKSGVAPKQIIAFTYTDKAAAELQSRITRLIKEEIGEIQGLSEMYIGTIHAWCLKSVQDLVFQYQKFSVLDAVKLKLFVDKKFNSIGMKDLNMRRFVDTDRFIGALSIIRESKLNPEYSIPPELSLALEKYEETLESSSYFDFTMIMTRALRHLKDDEVFRERILENIGYLIVDEYQDVNPIQENIINALYKIGANICTVGDDDQTLYQWRGSDITMIQKFRERYEDVEYISLEDNFRSSVGIVDIALKSISNNIKRLPKGMNATGHQSFEVGDILYNQYDSTDEEYRFIADTVASIRGTSFLDKEESETRGLDYSDCAILLRRWREAEPITAALEAASIPFIVKGVNNLFQTDEIQAAKAIFLFLDEQIDEHVLLDLWLEVDNNISKGNVEEAILWLKSKFPRDNRYYEQFIIQQIYMKFLDIAGVREELFLDENGQNASGYGREEIVFYNLGMFSQIIHDFETIYFKTESPYKLTTFLNFLRYSADGYYPEGWLNNTYKTPNAVQVMTIHQS
ncbi:MAG: ATP-dependent helicase, partial [Bacteroidetes bacterium]|nr:ATP-dependent helicase [Bacteroidota bacterium]